ncbi:beta-N-acetylglucosaminidase domain-containing protein [Streptomyces meridianus]|uniref:Beta-N-acetylglucosaminidase domain-containing protein n=1 Tax=Streptomyces meridianus TaxID=2938945 RepID=A0ABT0X085_9ACTN|nr:beta-N-acetylglucosaminidase domain-containing protein [Streptomyces meridianus]MCM2575977.1 beta-N-acetylglucosaminidase domain-containing protein [Streptomyces meridianus]
MGTTALAAAVIGSLLGAPHADAVPPRPDGPSASAPDRETEGRLPSVWPRPQQIRAAGASVPLGDDVTLVAGEDTDRYALDALRDVLRDAGARTVREVRPGAPLKRGDLVVLAGGAGARKALHDLGAPERGDLPSGGYRLAAGRIDGRETAALDGAGPDGLFHAVQTLRQLKVSDGGTAGFAGAVVRDWPGTGVRGTTEAFFGEPWTLEQRLEHLVFMGRTKQNRYLYAPGDDPYRQTRWRDPYPAGQRDEFRRLADRARRNHVTLGWAVAPGQSFCFASDEDLRALKRKVDAMWALGVRAFQLQFQDVSYSEWHCDEDSAAFGDGPAAAARAQARVANAVARHLHRRHPGAEPVSVLPTEYYQDGSTDYRRALASRLRPGIEVAWTGVGVVPETITGRELVETREAFEHPLLTVDNYPVNDYAQDRLFLGPTTGRDPAVATGSAGVLASAMQQPSASRIPLFTAADYAWNPRGYEPSESWKAAIDDLSGGNARSRAALQALAGNSSASQLAGADGIPDGDRESGYLRPLIEAFWRAEGDASGRNRAGGQERREAAERLRAAFRVMRGAPDRIPAGAGSLRSEVAPWLDQLSRYGRAGEHALDMLAAQGRDEGAAAWKAQREVERLRRETDGSPATVGKGVLDTFLKRALDRADAWTGADRAGSRSALDEDRSGLTATFGRVRTLHTVTVLAEPGGGASRIEARVPGKGWQRLGDLSGSGWTQVDGKEVRADAVRLSRPSGGRLPEVRHLVPWFTDDPAVRVRMGSSETEAGIGGASRTVAAELTGGRPGTVRGRIVAEAPDGVDIDVPDEVTLPRGRTASVPVRVTVRPGTPAGDYEVPIRFGDEERTLTVRAFPRTGGSDLARRARAESSGDETRDFPASAAVDGDSGTRWSSTARDDAWLQLELDRTVRLGQVVLRWEDAHASRYRVEVSEDGRRWRTAATVEDGAGGRESVRMDAPDTRFVRVQGERRATRFGYSLWSVEAYAVRD